MRYKSEREDASCAVAHKSQIYKNLSERWLVIGLSEFFGFIQEKLLIFFDNIGSPEWLKDLLVNGMYQTLTWVVSVMLPPMAIFFPLFTLFEDLGYLPRIAFNLDSCFKKVCSSGKQALTMCMGFGCNAAGVCRM